MNRSAEQNIARELLGDSRDLFVPRFDSNPMNPEKNDTHSLNKYNQANSSLSSNSQSYFRRDSWFHPCFKQLSESHSAHAPLVFPPISLSSQPFNKKGT